MRHTVRRSSRGVEQTGATRLRPTSPAARIADPGVTTGATPDGLDLGTARIPQKVPERNSDSRP
ncbi:hypothetical protein Sipo8835_29715 [Streptomyces ipomoeae]|uniref:Uncharacterized protein n=1 Tax=Streptomyces ipomoeae TaxID=103232 RepID=A0AAE8VY95_9ACTN|nr:hypothetical protein Sipo7851_43525 [Streptomyces ipomoeae]TQE26517.1 hypothetical protein Sipo8835_29715 [Streptomyces ipomoeae]